MVASASKADTKAAAIPCVVMDIVNTEITPDSAAEVSIVTVKLLKLLTTKGIWLSQQDITGGAAITGVGDKRLVIKSKVKLDLRFTTPGGPLVLHNVICWVTEQCLPPGVGDLLLSRWVMERLGYNPEKLFASAQQVRAGWDMGDVDDLRAGGVASVLAHTAAAEVPEVTEEERVLEDDEARACFPELDKDINTEREEIRAILLKKVDEAQQLGASDEFVKELEEILLQLIDVFRIVIGRDPPVDMPPMEVKLKPGAIPVKCKARRYSPVHRAFLKKHIDALISAGLCYRNPQSRWCSPPHVVNKPEANDYRMTVDVRGPNALVESVVWPMPILDPAFEQLRGSSRYFPLDFFKGFWQFAMAQICQEIYSILTEEGAISPARVLMGGTNSVAYVQSTVQQMFAEVFNNGLMIWIDDLLGYEDSDMALLTLLTAVLTKCAEKGLKLNPKKCRFYLREALWCGRVGEGVRHDPARIDALTKLPAPTTGQELQQFVCALNWMRASLPAFNKLIDPLVKTMEKVYELADGRKKRQVRSIRLSDAGRSEIEVACEDRCKKALQHALLLAHPDPEKQLSVYTDASDEHWGAAITQIPRDHANRPLSEQEHQPLMMLSGSFSGSAKRWAIVEKEAYAIVETCRRADYLLHRHDGFALFTDHRNLRYIFDPPSVSSSVPKYTADKLHRWSILLMGYKYEIHDIAGDENVWADLLSRWGSTFKTVCAIRQVPLPLSPQLDDTFVWPTLQKIVAAQRVADPPRDLAISNEGTISLWKDKQGRIWIPDDAKELQVRVCVVGHFGIAGHRGTAVTLKNISEKFIWKEMAGDVEFFVQRCLHCASTRGGPPQPRLLGEAMHAEHPNELLHLDFLYMGESDTGPEYILVIKDDASKYVWLVPSETADADTTFAALLDWFAAFGVCRSWVSDQGTHFKNKVIEALQHAIGAHHHFTTARCPWANGTVEVVNREALRCCRALLSEWRLLPHEWPRVIKIVQMVLTNSPSPSMGGVAPLTAMTGIKAIGPSDHIAVPGPIKKTSLAEIQTIQRGHVVHLQQALELMHKRINEASATSIAAGRKHRAKKRGTSITQFDVGDFVLYANVWQYTRSKLSVTWCGPARVVTTVSNWIFEIENLITGLKKEAHASRLKFYADASLNLTEELLLHIAHNSEGHVVDTLLEARYNRQEKRHEIKVHWRGLDSIEDS